MRHYGVEYRTGNSKVDDLLEAIHNNTLHQPNTLRMDGEMYDGWLNNMISLVEKLPKQHVVRRVCSSLYTGGQHWSIASAWDEEKCAQHYAALVDQLWPELEKMALRSKQ